MKVQRIRRIIQAISLIAVVLIPVLESYKLLLNYLPPSDIGHLWKNYSILSDAPNYLRAGHLSWILVFVDFFLKGLDNQALLLRQVLSYFGGSFWSVTVAGITINDPLALFQMFALHQSLTLGLVVSSLIPVALSLLLGRFFCSWICPIHAILELVHYIINKTGHTTLNLKLLTNQHLRYVLLAMGLLLPFMGYTLFPYVLPYAVMGRWFYYLSIGIIFLPGLILLLSLVVSDLIQRGLWCNFLCPTGALLTLTSRKSLVRITVEEASCLSNCSLCKNVCHWNANPKTMETANCTNCSVCIQKCPGKALKYTLLN